MHDPLKLDFRVSNQRKCRRFFVTNDGKSPRHSLTADRHPYETAEFEDFAQIARICSFPPCQAKNPRGAARVKAVRSQLRREVALRRGGHAGTLTAWGE